MDTTTHAPPIHDMWQMKHYWTLNSENENLSTTIINLLGKKTNPEHTLNNHCTNTTLYDMSLNVITDVWSPRFIPVKLLVLEFPMNVITWSGLSSDVKDNIAGKLNLNLQLSSTKHP